MRVTILKSHRRRLEIKSPFLAGVLFFMAFYDSPGPPGYKARPGKSKTRRGIELSARNLSSLFFVFECPLPSLYEKGQKLVVREL